MKLRRENRRAMRRVITPVLIAGVAAVAAVNLIPELIRYIRIESM